MIKISVIAMYVRGLVCSSVCVTHHTAGIFFASPAAAPQVELHKLEMLSAAETAE